MNIKKFPAWLIGGIIGVAYFVITFLFEFVAMCNFQMNGMCGLFTAIANLPATFILQGVLGQSIVLQIFLYILVNFCLGALVFGLINRFWKWQDR